MIDLKSNKSFPWSLTNQSPPTVPLTTLHGVPALPLKITGEGGNSCHQHLMNEWMNVEPSYNFPPLGYKNRRKTSRAEILWQEAVGAPEHHITPVLSGARPVHLKLWSSCFLRKVWGAEGGMRSQWEPRHKGLFVERCCTALHIVVEGTRWSISSGRCCIYTNQNACSFLCWNIVIVLYYIKGEHLYLMVIWVGYDIAWCKGGL